MTSPGKGKPAGEHVVVTHNGVNYGYLGMLKVPVIQGRDFSRDYPSDSGALIINEKFRDMMGFKDPIGKRITFLGGRHPIIGVVKDFHLRSLRDPIEPLILFLADTSNYVYGGGVLVKTVPGREHEAVASMEKVFRSLEPAFPFRYYFADEDYQKLYNSEQTVSRLADSFSALAIVISCLGLLGLSMFTAEQRRKEIGVRKVIGASTGSIIALLSREIVQPICPRRTGCRPHRRYRNEQLAPKLCLSRKHRLVGVSSSRWRRNAHRAGDHQLAGYKGGEGESGEGTAQRVIRIVFVS